MRRAEWWAAISICALAIGGNAASAVAGTWFAAGVAAVLTGGAAAAVRAAGTRSRLAWAVAGVACAAAGAGGYAADVSARSACTTHYAGRVVVTGTALTETAERARREDPSYTSERLLFDAAGSRQDVWTADSIRDCERRVALTGPLWIPLFGCAVLCAMAATGARWRLRAAAGQPVAPGAPVRVRYDAFVSYRHGGEDAEFARRVVEELEAAGYRLAIDERDFRAEQSFLQEMERCIRESRFTLALISGRFLESGHTEEEALLAKVLDMGERKRRLVPLVLQRVELPAWLYGIVGIDFTAEAGLVDPMDKLKATLGAPLAKAVTIDGDDASG